jgi:bifunctional DNA-binding transcriptional regulator/antitoxin component of YhaV-PrlF toxin-antitoxin module
MQKFCIFCITDKENKMTDATLQVRKRGVVTFPSDLRERYGIREGDSYRLVDVDGIFVLTPMTPMVPELAREIERLRQEAGLSVEEFLKGLREQRARYTAEKYGEDQPA